MVQEERRSCLITTVAVERAAKVALDAGALTYRAVKACLVHYQAAPLALRQVDPLIRGLTEYRDLVCRITGGEVLFLGAPGTGKSHLAQALGLCAIQQGHRVVHRERRGRTTRRNREEAG